MNESLDILVSTDDVKASRLAETDRFQLEKYYMTTTSYASDRTGLLLVDPYSDFLSEGTMPLKMPFHRLTPKRGLVRS